MRKKSELVFSLLLLPVDFVAIITAFITAYIIRVKLDGRPVATPVGALLFFKIFLVIVPFWILIFALAGLYNTNNLKRRFTELGKIFIGTAGGSMLVILVDFVSQNPIFPSKSIPVYGFVLSLAYVTVARQLVNSLRRFLYGFGIGVQQVVLIGSGEIAQQIAADLGNKRSGYRVLAAVDSSPKSSRRLGGLKTYQSFERLLQAISSNSIDEILQADSALEPDEVLGLVHFAAEHHIRYRFVPNQFGLFATNAQFSTISGLPVIEIRQTPLDGWGRITKRGFDLLGALAGIILLSPLFLIIAIISLITNPGPVFYKHKRLSRNGEYIYIYKFRTMLSKWSDGEGYQYKTAAEAFKAMGREDVIDEFLLNQKLRHDPRVNSFGQLLRRSSLDELPQLFNVIIGNLSLVGPRPIVESELNHYGEQAPVFLALKPGITGMWQVSGRSDVSYAERVKLDIYYAENWSPWLDIQILVKTIRILLHGRGAY